MWLERLYKKIQHTHIHTEKKNNGQMLVEVMVALSVTAISLTGFFGLMRTSIGLNNFTSSNYTATYTAAEGIEVVKNILDQNFYARKNFYDWGSNTLPQDVCGNYPIQYDSQASSPSLDPTVVTPCGSFSSFSTPTVADASSVTWVAPMSPQNTFSRVVQVALDKTQDAIRVRSWVFWTAQGQQFHVVLEDYFYDWWKPQSING